MPAGHKRGGISFAAGGEQSREVRRSSCQFICSPFTAFSGRYLHVLVMALAVFACLRPAWAQVNLSPAEPRATPPVQVPTFPARPPDIDIPLPEQLAPEGAGKIKFVLGELVIEGGTVYSPEELREFYAELIGTEVSVARLFEVAKQIQQKYRDDGYPLTRVIIPEQTIRNDLFRLRIIEGFINHIEIEGDIGPVRSRVQAYLEKLIGRRPIREQELERYLLLATDIPGLTATGTFRRGVGDFGAAKLVVSVERKPFDVTVLANNRGSRFTGTRRAAITVQENASTRLGERLEAYLFMTEDNEQKYGHLAYEQLLGSEGLKLRVLGSISPSKPGGPERGPPLDTFGVETESLYGTTALTYPILRSRDRNLNLRGGFDAIRSTVDVTDGPNLSISRDHLRVVHADASYDFKDRFAGQSAVGLGIRQGLHILNASENNDPNKSRVEGKSNATVVKGRASRHQPLKLNFSLVVSAQGQYAFDTLLSDEQFSVGGEQYGRGFDPSDRKGDHGLGFTSELRYSRPARLGPLRGYQAYGFYDLGVVWQRASREAREQRRDQLASVGIGVRTQLLDNFFADLELAKPVVSEPATMEKGRDPRLSFQLLAHF